MLADHILCKKLDCYSDTRLSLRLCTIIAWHSSSNKGGYHGIHPWHCGTKVSGVGEIVMTKGLLKFLSHLLKVSEITGFLQCGQY